MKYKFKCAKCDEIIELEMSVKEYGEFESKCETCGEDLKRIYETPLMGGLGDPSDSSGGISSCSGVCSGCSGGCSA